jgi:hypothetical protein
MTKGLEGCPRVEQVKDTGEEFDRSQFVDEADLDLGACSGRALPNCCYRLHLGSRQLAGWEDRELAFGPAQVVADVTKRYCGEFLDDLQFGDREPRLWRLRDRLSPTARPFCDT